MRAADRLLRGGRWMLLLLALLGSRISTADEGPRLGTVVGVEQAALLVRFEDAPGTDAQRIALSGRSGQVDWQPGMPVRVWPGSADQTGSRVTPVGVAGGFDRTGVRRRLSRGARGGGFGSSGPRGAGRGGH